MKKLYVCEKCGKTFEDYDAASNCEYGHKEPCSICELKPLDYAEGDLVPKAVTVSFSGYDFENGKFVYTYVSYKRDKVFTAAQNAEMESLRLARERKREEEMEAWRARRRAEEEAKQAAQAAEESAQADPVGA